MTTKPWATGELANQNDSPQHISLAGHTYQIVKQNILTKKIVIMLLGTHDASASSRVVSVRQPLTPN